jgi:NTP pyrophosphatase (non-canonical NTP hydrolase)
MLRTERERREVYRVAWNTWGMEAQTWMVVEEAAELILAICKLHRAIDRTGVEDLIEEIADVRVMLEQTETILGDDIPVRVEEVMEEKLIRLEQRIRDAKTIGRVSV